MTQQDQLCSFRNLYRIDSAAGRVVAFVTATSHTRAEERYSLNGGAEQDIVISQLTHGYPSDECQIIA